MTSSDGNIAYIKDALARDAAALGEDLFGKPSFRSRNEIRWGSKGSRAITLTGRRKGRTEVSAPSLRTCHVLARHVHAPRAGRPSVGRVSLRGCRLDPQSPRMGCLCDVCDVWCL